MKKNIFRGLKKKYFFPIISILLIYLMFYITRIGCPIKFISGISCAGCGMTRSYYHLLHGNITEAFHFHPLFILPPLIIVVLIFQKYIPRKLKISFTIICIFVFLIVYIFRLLNQADSVVVFNPSTGLIYRFANYVIHLMKGV